MKTAAVTTLGCKVNQVESGSIIEQLSELGYTIVDFDQPADLYIINTCTVTSRTDSKSRNLIRLALKQKALNPSVKLFVTGCYAQKEPDEIKGLGGIDLIVDNQSKIDVGQWLQNPEYEFQDIMTAKTMSWKLIKSMHERTRAFLKIQDGCDYYCAYCAVPYGRGNARSLAFEEVVEQAEILCDNGYREIVLSGVNLGLYADIESGKKLSDVIKALVEIDKLILLRISSLEPDLWSEELLDCLKSSGKICPHFHIPLQSGSDTVLKRMGRRYSTAAVRNLIFELRAINHDCAIGLDIISGFPGESEAEHKQTLAFLKGVEPAYLHVFSYSRRKGTPAAQMPNQVNGAIIRKRASELTTLSNILKDTYKQILIENKFRLRGIVERLQNGVGSALSGHYIRVYQRDNKLKENDLLDSPAERKFKDGIMLISDCQDESIR